MKRRWRQQAGALLMASVLALALGFASREAPVGGEPLYFTLLLVLCGAAVIASPLILNTESVLSSRSVDLIPITGIARWTLGIVFGNSLRTLLCLVLVTWGFLILLPRSTDAIDTGVQLLQLLGWAFVALATSQLLEDVIRHRRAVVLHQVVFLVGLAFWPLLLGFLRDETNFVPAASWTTGPASVLLLTAPTAPLNRLAAGLAGFVLGILLVRGDQRFLEGYAFRPTAPPASVRWTAALARLFVGQSAQASLLYKELLVPLRFLFLRMSVIFILLTSVAAFVSGIPLLLLGIAFWWQPLSTNMLGPDLEDGLLRYRLIGQSLEAVLRRRLAAMTMLTVAAVTLSAAVCLLGGWVATPVAGPPDRLMYPVVFLYSLSLLALWAVGADRYSVHFPDHLEMHTLLPERKRSAGAGALVALLIFWSVTMLVALAILGVALAVVVVAMPGPLDLARTAAVVVLAAAGNAVAYHLHARSFAADAFS